MSKNSPFCEKLANYLKKKKKKPFWFYSKRAAGVCGSSLTACPCCRYTYEVAPVFVLMEEVVLSTLRSLIGWDSGDGIFCPGGSISNLYAMNLARYRAFPEVKQRGLWAVPRLAVFTSKEVGTLRRGRTVCVIVVCTSSLHRRPSPRVAAVINSVLCPAVPLFCGQVCFCSGSRAAERASSQSGREVKTYSHN